jgi:hypothetical protein
MGSIEDFRMRGGVEVGAPVEDIHIANNPVDDEDHKSYKGEPVEADGWDD